MSLTLDLNTVNDKLFSDVVGQNRFKRAMRAELDDYLYNRHILNKLLIAPKGQGKTFAAREIAKGLYEFDKDGSLVMVQSQKDGTIKPRRKTYVPLNAASLKNVDNFVNNVLLRHVVDKDSTIFIDEAHALSDKVTDVLLTLLNPNPTHKNTYDHNGLIIDVDFKRNTFLFATSEPQSMFHALKDRLDKITLENYTQIDLAEIIRRNLVGVTTDDAVLMDVATVIKGNARAAQKMSEKIMAHLRRKNQFTLNDWQEFKEIQGIRPFGLDSEEIKILLALNEVTTGMSLTCLSNKTELSRASLQGEFENYLQKLNFMVITTNGREITHKGRQYLKDLNVI